jgi:hypothetical protein
MPDIVSGVRKSTKKNQCSHWKKWRRFLHTRRDLWAGTSRRNAEFRFRVLEAFAARLIYREKFTSANNYLSTVWCRLMRKDQLRGRNLQWKYTDLRRRVKLANGKPGAQAAPCSRDVLTASKDALLLFMCSTGLRPVAMETCVEVGSMKTSDGRTLARKFSIGTDKIAIERRRVYLFCACRQKWGGRTDDNLCLIHGPLSKEKIGPVPRSKVVSRFLKHGLSSYAGRRAFIMGMEKLRLRNGHDRERIKKSVLNNQLGWTAKGFGSYDRYAKGAADGDDDLLWPHRFYEYCVHGKVAR